MDNARASKDVVKRDIYLRRQRKRSAQLVRLVFARPAVKATIKQLRGKWGVPDSGFSSGAGVLEWRKWLGVRSNEFEKDVEEFRRSAHKSPRWSYAFESSILCNFEDNLPPYRLLNPTIHKKIDLETGDEVIWIEITEDTSEVDIRAVFPRAKQMMLDLGYREAEKFQPIKRLDRDQKAYELRKANPEKTLQQVGDMMVDIQREEGKQGQGIEFYSGADVSRMIARYKKRLSPIARDS